MVESLVSNLQKRQRNESQSLILERKRKKSFKAMFSKNKNMLIRRHRNAMLSMIKGLLSTVPRFVISAYYPATTILRQSHT